MADFEKASDTLEHDMLWRALQEQSIPQLYNNSSNVYTRAWEPQCTPKPGADSSTSLAGSRRATPSAHA
eukprot:9318495-Pyramimonas_sp.AAC.1